MASIAKSLDISEGYYCLIENGKRQEKMDITLLARISSALDIPIAEAAACEARPAP